MRSVCLNRGTVSGSFIFLLCQFVHRKLLFALYFSTNGRLLPQSGWHCLQQAGEAFISDFHLHTHCFIGLEERDPLVRGMHLETPHSSVTAQLTYRTEPQNTSLLRTLKHLKIHNGSTKLRYRYHCYPLYRHSCPVIPLFWQNLPKTGRLLGYGVSICYNVYYYGQDKASSERTEDLWISGTGVEVRWRDEKINGRRGIVDG